MILLISDLHLEEERPDITRAFLDLLHGRARGAQALYILGDFFEAWIGDDGMTPFQRSICAALRELSDSGTPIFIMHGNRDFLIGKAFCKAAGATLLKDPSVVQFYGEPVLLMHGDSLCTRDVGYMKLRRILRNPIVLFVLRHLPLGTIEPRLGILFFGLVVVFTMLAAMSFDPRLIWETPHNEERLDDATQP